jgi:hypothetical protein
MKSMEKANNFFFRLLCTHQMTRGQDHNPKNYVLMEKMKMQEINERLLKLQND